MMNFGDQTLPQKLTNFLMGIFVRVKLEENHMNQNATLTSYRELSSCQTMEILIVQ